MILKGTFANHSLNIVGYSCLFTTTKGGLMDFSIQFSEDGFEDSQLPLPVASVPVLPALCSVHFYVFLFLVKCSKRTCLNNVT